MPNPMFQPDLDDLDYDQILGKPQGFEPDLTDFDYDKALNRPESEDEGYWTAAINEFFKPQTTAFSSGAKALTDPYRKNPSPYLPQSLQNASLAGIDFMGGIADQMTSSGDLTALAMTLAGLGGPAAGLKSVQALNALSKGVKASNLLPMVHGGTGMVNAKSIPDFLGSALETGLGAFGYKTAKPILPRGSTPVAAEAAAAALTPEQILEQKVAEIVKAENLAMRPPEPPPAEVGSYVSKRTLKNPRQLTIPYRGQTALGESPIPEVPPDWDSALGRNNPARPVDVPIEQPLTDDFVRQIEEPNQGMLDFEDPGGFREVVPQQSHPMDDVIPPDLNIPPPARPMPSMARPTLPEFQPDMLMSPQAVEGGYSPTFGPRGIPEEIIPEQILPDEVRPDLDTQPLQGENPPESWSVTDLTVGQEDWPSTAWKQQLDELDAVGAPDEAYANITGGRGVPGQSQRDRVLAFIDADIKGRTEIANEESIMRRMFSGDQNAPLMEKEDLVESMMRGQEDEFPTIRGSLLGEPGSAERYRSIALEHGQTWRTKQAKLDRIKAKEPDNVNWDADWEHDTRVRSVKEAEAEIEYFKDRERRALDTESMLRQADEGDEVPTIRGQRMPENTGLGSGPIEIKRSPDGTFDMNDPTTARIVNIARGGRPPTMAEKVSPSQTVKMPVEDLPKDASLKYIKREMRKEARRKGKPPKKAKTWAEQNWKERGLDLASISRAIQSSYDLSMPFRQGLGLIHTKGWWNSWKGMIDSALKGEGAYNAVIESIEMSPNYRLGKAMGLQVTDLGELAAREEEFGAALAEKIPGFGTWGIKRSNMAASAFMNKLRMDTFDSLMLSAEKGGLKPRENVEFMKSLTEYINNASGRGTFKSSSMEKSAEALNQLFFSPRLIKARTAMLDPRSYLMGDKFIRKQYLKSLMSLGGAWLTFSKLMELRGAEVAPMDDPSNANFGKIRWGNTRIDPTGGLLPYINLASRLAKGGWEGITGQQQSRYGGRVVDPTPFSDVGEFLFNKTAPVPRFAFDLTRAQQWRPFYLGDEMARMVTPIILQDILEVAGEDGDWSKLLNIKTPSIAALSAVGFGTNTYVEGKPSRMIPESWIPPEDDIRFPAMTPQMQRRLQTMRRRTAQ